MREGESEGRREGVREGGREGRNKERWREGEVKRSTIWHQALRGTIFVEWQLFISQKHFHRSKIPVTHACTILNICGT